MGFDEAKTQAAIRVHNKKVLTRLHENLLKMDQDYIQKHIDNSGYYGADDLKKFMAEGPTPFLGKEKRYGLDDLIRQIRKLQGQVNNDGASNKISGTDHFVWSNGLKSDDIVLDNYDAQREGLQKYREALPDLDTDEGQAKVYAAAFVRRVVDEWAGNSDTPQSQAMQMAASEYARSIGIKADDFSGLQKYSASNYRQALDLYQVQRLALFDLARSMYEQTQADLKAQGITSVWGSRGMAVDDRAPWMVDSPDSKGFGQDELDFQQNPLTSWSTDLGTSAGFGDARYKFVAYREIPANEIFCTAMTGLGCLHEYEMVLLGTKQSGMIRWVDTDDTTDGQDWLEGGSKPVDITYDYTPSYYPAKKAAKKAAPAINIAAAIASVATAKPPNMDNVLEISGLDDDIHFDSEAHKNELAAYMAAVWNKNFYAYLATGSTHAISANQEEADLGAMLPEYLYDDENVMDKLYGYYAKEGRNLAEKAKANVAAAPKKAMPAKKAVPKVTAGTTLYVNNKGRFYKQTLSGQWSSQGLSGQGWYTLPKGWKPHGLKLYKPPPVKKAVPAKKSAAKKAVPAKTLAPGIYQHDLGTKVQISATGVGKYLNGWQAGKKVNASAMKVIIDHPDKWEKIEGLPAKKAAPAKKKIDWQAVVNPKAPTELGLKNQLESGMITLAQYQIGMANLKAKKAAPAKKAATTKKALAAKKVAGAVFNPSALPPSVNCPTPTWRSAPT